MDRIYTPADIQEVAAEVLNRLVRPADGATVLGLSGDLGAGKTTLTQSLATALGVQETVVSPTFVIAKYYPTAHADWDTLVHMDAYRIDDLAELAPLGWDALCATPRTLVIVEWPERIAQALPASTIRFHIDHEGEARRIRQL
jgi:tRNA threonylcarbamoyl adenosine modification protein YjeE